MSEIATWEALTWNILTSKISLSEVLLSGALIFEALTSKVSLTEEREENFCATRLHSASPALEVFAFVLLIPEPLMTPEVSTSKTSISFERRTTV